MLWKVELFGGFAGLKKPSRIRSRGKDISLTSA
jgi:hypothetical protein